MSNPAYEHRQANKRLKMMHRKAAARLHGTELNRSADVKLMHGGAFVEVTVWVPASEAYKEKADD